MVYSFAPRAEVNLDLKTDDRQTNLRKEHGLLKLGLRKTEAESARIRAQMLEISVQLTEIGAEPMCW